MIAIHRTGFVLAASLLASVGVLVGNAHASDLPGLEVAAVNCVDFDSSGNIVGANFMELIGAGSVEQEPVPFNATSAKCTSDPGSTGLMVVTATFGNGITQTVNLRPGRSGTILAARPAPGTSLNAGGGPKVPGMLRLTGKLQVGSALPCVLPFWRVSGSLVRVTDVCLN